MLVLSNHSVRVESKQDQEISIRGRRERYETLSAHCIIGHSVLCDIARAVIAVRKGMLRGSGTAVCTFWIHS
jgi:hypothetical protein